MKLHMKQRVFSFGDKFNIWDVSGADRWFVEEELFAWGKTLYIYDASGREAACIKREVFTFRPRFYITIGGREVAEIVKHFTLFCQEYEVNGPGWQVEGSFWEHAYAAYQGQRQVVSIEKEWLTWGDCYTIDIADPQDELLALCVVLAIDSVNESN